MKHSSRANSFVESSSSVSPRQARRAAGSSRRSPTSASSAARRPAAGERAQPREQLPERERLRQVVVGAGSRARRPGRRPRRVPSASAPASRPLRREAGGSTSKPSSRAASHRARSRRTARRAIQSASSPSAGDVGRMALLAQRRGEQRRQLRLVLDDQHAHRVIVAVRRGPLARMFSSGSHRGDH